MNEMPGWEQPGSWSARIGKRNVPGIVYLGLGDYDKTLRCLCFTPHSIKADAVEIASPVVYFIG